MLTGNGDYPTMPTDKFFANVVVDIPANTVKSRLFTYAIPDSLVQGISPGVVVLVPFGSSKAVTGFVVSVRQGLPEDFAQNIEVKEILTLLDEQVFFDSEYIKFLQWIADYYLSSLMDVMIAALPACLVPRLKQTVRLLDTNLQEQEKYNQQELAILDELKATKSNTLSLSVLKQRWRKRAKEKENQFYKVFNRLLADNIIERANEISKTSTIKTKDMLTWTNKEPSTVTGKRVVAVLQEHGGRSPKPLLVKSAKVSNKVINSLLEDGVLLLSKEDQIRDPLQYLDAEDKEKSAYLHLTADQKHVLSVLNKALLEQLKNTETNVITPWLLHGVTGSGKTEIYMQLIEETLKQNCTALLMVPEIALTPQLAQRLNERFGKQVAVWHSGLSDGERFDTWRLLQNGELKILLGARSAILVNIPSLGLIILDEEHDGSYKQTSPPPRYNAKTLALEKAKLSGAMVLYGSATPDVVAYYQAQKENKILSLPKRVFDQGFPKTVIVDMRSEFLSGNRSIFSQPLAKAIEECLSRKEQSILLLNRRGYASHVFCRACGYVAACKNCSVPMVYHRTYSTKSGQDFIDTLVCHHCGFQSRLGQDCPVCHQPFLKHYGLGTQRVESDLQELLPQAKILRLDSDITQKKGAHEEIFKKFSSHQADVLIGTQMVAKGLDNANVTLVGILAADAAFNLSDYRCTERGFQLLTQVAGRAGRGNLPGTVIVQTFNPQLPALKFALSHDYHSFYDAELPSRESFSYPPFSQLIRIVVAGNDQEKTKYAAERIAETLSTYFADTKTSDLTILGPAPCLLEKLHNKWRQHLIIKNQLGEEGHNLIAAFFKNRPTIDDVQVAVDMDAVDLI